MAASCFHFLPMMMLSLPHTSWRPFHGPFQRLEGSLPVKLAGWATQAKPVRLGRALNNRLPRRPLGQASEAGQGRALSIRRPSCSSRGSLPPSRCSPGQWPPCLGCRTWGSQPRPSCRTHLGRRREGSDRVCEKPRMCVQACMRVRVCACMRMLVCGMPPCPGRRTSRGMTTVTLLVAARRRGLHVCACSRD